MFKFFGTKLSYKFLKYLKLLQPKKKIKIKFCYTVISALYQCIIGLNSLT